MLIREESQGPSVLSIQENTSKFLAEEKDVHVLRVCLQVGTTPSIWAHCPTPLKMMLPALITLERFA